MNAWIQKLKKIFLEGFPPWVLLGAVAVLFPILTLMTLNNIRTQQANNERLLLEKGAALIRSFEAGTRTGMMGGRQSFRLQRLLMETSQQPDIVYLMVIDATGDIVAHSIPEQIGQKYGSGLNFKEILSHPVNRWRIVETADGKRVFEVYRRFMPSRRGIPPHHPMHGQRRHNECVDCKAIPGLSAPQMIFVGLDLAMVEAAGQADRRHSIIMGVILLFVGLAGVYLLFFIQNYRSARLSLTRIKAFSDHLVENMPIGVLSIDKNGFVAAFNQAAAVILQLPASKVAGSLAESVLPREVQPLLRPVNGASGIAEGEVEAVLQDGSVVPLEVRSGVLRDDDGTFVGSVLLFKDLTEVRDLRREIARSQRLASVGRLAAGVAHEIRNPLSSIKGFATYFKERYHDVPEDLNISEIMIEEVDRLNRVVTQLLEFARPVNITPRETDLNRFIADSILLIQRQADAAGIDLRTTLLPDPVFVRIDPDRMRQVLLNLYLNAIESMGESGGTLSIALSTEKENQAVRITVADTGAGIEPDDLAHIFDPYYTTKPTGTGIGLATAHNIVKAHGGSVTVKSRPESGTRFSIVIPAAPGETPS